VLLFLREVEEVNTLSDIADAAVEEHVGARHERALVRREEKPEATRVIDPPLPIIGSILRTRNRGPLAIRSNVRSMTETLPLCVGILDFSFV
jgi:hypothetical protein